MKELRKKFDEKQLLFTISVVSPKKYLIDAFNYRAIAKYLDFLHFQLSLDYDYSWERFYELRKESEDAINKSTKLDVPLAKSLIDINFGGILVFNYNRPDSKPHFYFAENSDKICFKILFYNLTIHSYGTKNQIPADFGYGAVADEGDQNQYQFESSRTIANKI